MAGACRASLSISSPPPVNTTARRFPLTSILSASASFSKSHPRKNYLRTKILRTLTKPLPTLPPPEIFPPEPLLPVAIPVPLFYEPSDAPSISAGEMDDVESLQASSTVDNAGELGWILGKISANSVLKVAVFAIGFFALEAVVVRLLFRTSEKEDRLASSGKSDKLGSPIGNAGYFNESELGEKIGEIRAMAREARESEKKQLPKDEHEIGIDKEVSARLVKLKKKLESKKDMFPASLINTLGLFGNGEDDMNNNDVSGEDEPVPLTLMVKKKHRFRSPSIKTMTAPRGFSGSKDSNGSVKGNQNGESRKSGIGASTKEKGMKAGSSSRNSGNVGPMEDNLRKETESGAVQGTAEATNSRKGGIESLSVTKGKKRSSKNSNSVDSLSRGDGERRVKNNLKDKRSALVTDIWWSKLPYVLAILMRRGTEDEGEEGFYVVQLAPAAAGQRNSCTVAFEDRSDAKNFSFLLECFFEGLEEFSVDVVPVPVRKLQEEMKSESKKVVVVRKGELKLYAGQPFEEVEMALRSLIEQSQNM
ncbi:hypothetical protein LINPERHAP1_LOCUS42558 [Linum perenne]